MKHPLLLFVIFALSISANAQTVEMTKQKKLSRKSVPPANYSGICRLGGDKYAVVSDKEKDDGYYIFKITINPTNGKLEDAERIDYKSSAATSHDKWGNSIRDIEGIAYKEKSGTIYMAGEGDGQILEYDTLGRTTGRRFEMPSCYSLNNTRPNKGLESLAYSSNTDLFWTTTESTLKNDGESADNKNKETENLLRITSFDSSLRPTAQYAYKMEQPRCANTKKRPSLLLTGVSDICALPDGRLIVMEREVYYSRKKTNSYCVTRLFAVDPSTSRKIDKDTPLSQMSPDQFMKKTEICSFTTCTNLLKRSIANYEGICLGPRLNNGRQTLILINDTQNGLKKYGVRLKEYIKVIVLPLHSV